MRYLAFGCLSLVILLIIEPMHSWVLMWLFYVTLILAFLALRVTAKPAQLLASTRRFSKYYARVGEQVTVQVSVNWQAVRGPGWILVRDTMPDALQPQSPCGHLATLDAESTTSFHYRVIGERRGYYAIGPLSITLGDLFGFAQSSAASTDTAYLTVYPAIVAVPDLRLPSNRPIGDAPSSKRIYEDATRIVGVRDYCPGDTLTKIHWKSTARLGTLVSKMCEPSTSVESQLLLNLHYLDYPDDETVELACTTVASLASRLQSDKHLFGLQTNGYDPIWEQQRSTDAFGVTIRPGKGEQQAAAVLSVLGRVQPSQTPPLAEYLTFVSSTLPWTASILLVTHHLSEESAVLLGEWRKKGFELAIIIVGAGEMAEQSRIRAAALNIPVAIVYTEKHLGQMAFWQPGRD